MSQVSYQNKTLTYLSNIKALQTCHCLTVDKQPKKNDAIITSALPR